MITAISMGPPQAEALIREAYTMGVDEGYLLSDRKFAGSDVLATAYTLSIGIKTIGKYDVIICGKQTTDGDTGQVGPAIAEYLGIAHVAWVRAIKEIYEDHFKFENDMTEIRITANLIFPCVLSVDKDLLQPRLPSYIRKLEQKTDRFYNGV